MQKGATSRNLRCSARATPSKRKAKESPASAPEPKRKCTGKKSDNGRDIDRYCWLCHKSDGNLLENICSICPRVYHTLCLDKYSSEFSDKNVCPECIMETINGVEPKPFTVQRLRDLLMATTRQKISNKEFGKKHKLFIRWPPNIGDSELVKVIDFEILIDKINDTVPYTKTSEFFSDLKWIQHNCIILFGSTSKVSDSAIKLVKAFKTDLLDLEACPECYYHMLHPKSRDFFVRICDSPHDIIWAKVSGYPYWPAKCLNIINGVAHVRFFGTHDMGEVPITQCYAISKAHPNAPQRKAPKTPKYLAAMQELSKYISIYERRFGVGSFILHEERTAFTPENTTPIVPVESVSTHTNIRNLPLHVDPIENNITTSAGNSPYGVTDLTFSEEPSRTFNELDSPGSSTLNTVPSIDLRMCTETTIVHSTPVLVSSSTVIDLSEDDLNVEGNLSNVSESRNSKTVANNDSSLVTNSNDSSPEVTQTTPATEEVPISPDVNSVLSSSTNSDIELETIDTIDESFVMSSTSTPDNAILNSMDASLVPVSRTQKIDKGLIMSFLGTYGDELVSSSNRDLRSWVCSIFAHLWTLGNKAPTAAEVLTSVVRDLESCKAKLDYVEKDNANLKLFIRNRTRTIGILSAELQTLMHSHDALKRKNARLKMEFEDATKNAKLVVNGIKQQTNKFWSKKLNEQKAMYMHKLEEKDNEIAELESQLETLKSSYKTLQDQTNELATLFTDCKRSSKEVQTELCHLDVYSKNDVDQQLEENTFEVERSKEKELHKDIIDAKRGTFCYVCLKPAEVHCCILANYCSPACQKKHAKRHAGSCFRKSELPPAMKVPKQISQSQTVTIDYHIQVEKSVHATLDSHDYRFGSSNQ